uniref:Uncharacterized protein n=1 Tax=Anguilla anguilla TaxID=7936 RepID=A0A0E9SAS1_ANGAN
MQNSNHWEAAV